MTTLASLLRRGLELSDGSQGKLAAALGVSRPWITRVLNGEGGLGVEPCLALADLCGEEPRTVLIAAGQEAFLGSVARLTRSASTADRQSKAAVVADLLDIETASPVVYKRVVDLIGELARDARRNSIQSRARRRRKP